MRGDPRGWARELLGAASTFSRTIVALAAIGGLVLAVGPYSPTARHDVASIRTRLFPRPEFVQPSAAPSGDAIGDLVDRNAETAWTSTVPTSITFHFGQAINLFKVGVLSGLSARADGYNSTGRPRHVELEAYGSDGRHLRSKSVELADKPAFQSFTFNAVGADRVDVRIDDTYPGTGPGGTVALREIEFFRRS